jgi:hypothetical protein
MGEVYGTYRGKRNAYSVLRGKPKGTRKLTRPRHRLRHNPKMNHKGIGWEVPLAPHTKLLGGISQLHGISFGSQKHTSDKHIQ